MYTLIGVYGSKYLARVLKMIPTIQRTVQQIGVIRNVFINLAVIKNGSRPDPQPLSENTDEDLVKVQSLKTDGCKCSLKCSAKFTETDMINHIRTVREMEKSEKDMYIIGTLVDFDKTKRKKANEEKETMEFIFQGQCVCKALFMTLHVIGRKGLMNIISHVEENGPVPRIHGNTGKRKAHGLSFEDIKCVVQIIINYANVNGMPQPAAPR